MPSDKRKLRRAALIAVLVGIPALAAGWYYFPRDIFVYVFVESDVSSVMVSLNGETVIDQAAPVHRDYADLPFYMAKRTVIGPDFTVSVRAPYRTPVYGEFSAFQGTHIHVFIQQTIYIAQMTSGPYFEK